jgi:enoyl-CoA hydratase
MIEVSKDRGVARITLGTGRRANALTSDGWVQLAEVAGQLGADEELRVVVISGGGRSAFSAGSDMREWVQADPSQVEASFAHMEQALTAIERLPVPVIAAVRGIAAGAGCQLACACDLRIITERSRIGMPVARWGILVSASFAARLSLLAGPGTTRDLLYTGRLVTGAEAVRLGLATRCVPEGELEQVTEQTAADIAAQPAPAVRAAKQAVEAALAPVRAAVRAQPAGPSADYSDLQHSISRFLRPAG